MIKTPKVWSGIGEKKSNGGSQYFQQDRIYEMGDISLALPSSLPGGSYKYLERRNAMERIRKLTPRECWRLQGFSTITKTESGYEFDDTLFERAESVCSNSQLYKQAGNSITVDVLYYICKNLFYPDDAEKEEENGQMTMSGI